MKTNCGVCPHRVDIGRSGYVPTSYCRLNNWRMLDAGSFKQPTWCPLRNVK